MPFRKFGGKTDPTSCHGLNDVVFSVGLTMSNAKFCRLFFCPFSSYNVSVIMDNEKRGPSIDNVAGLSLIYEEDGYFDRHLLRWDRLACVCGCSREIRLL